MFRFCCVLAFLTFSLPLPAEDTSSRETQWQAWSQKIKEGRQKPDSVIFYESYKSIEETGEVTLSRSVHGSSINKLKSSTTAPDLSQGQSILGLVKADADSASGYSFYLNQSDQKLPLVLDQIVEHESLGIGILLNEYDGELYVDFYNYQRPYRERLEKPQFFAYDADWVVHARFLEMREEVETPTSNNSQWDDVRLGFIEFNYQGNLYRVAVYEYDDFDKMEGEVQLRFGDQSKETYPGGRYLYVDIKDLKNPDGFVVDFNFSFDPPCAWSQGYVCSLIRIEDEELPIAVEAGYKTPLADLY